MKNKKILSLFLSSLLISSIITTPITAHSETSKTHFPITYKSSNTDYLATKISHPNDDIMQADGIVDYENGENDRGENYSWSAVGHGDYMYVGVLYGSILQTLKIIAAQNNIDFQVLKSGIDVLFNGELFMGDEENNPNNENRSMLLKINTKTGEVNIIKAPNNTSYRAAIEYKDKLYFAASCSQPYLLEIDPTDDSTKVVYTSQKPTKPFISVGIRGLAVVNDELVASMIGDDGAYIVSSSNPSVGPSSFNIIATQKDLLDYPAYHYNDSIFGGAIWDIIEFNHKLYVSVVTGKSGDKQAFAIFCGEKNTENNTWKFNLLVGDENDGAKYPYGLGAERSGAANLFVYDNHLYIGGYNDPMIALPSALNMDFEPLYKDLSSPVCLWRMDTNENIEMVAGDPNELFPTVLGNQSAGFGSNLNQYVWRMAEYDNKLFVGTFDMSSLAYPLMQFTNGDILHMTPEELESQINYIKIFLELLKEKYPIDTDTNTDNNIDDIINSDSTIDTDTNYETNNNDKINDNSTTDNNLNTNTDENINTNINSNTNSDSINNNDNIINNITISAINNNEPSNINIDNYAKSSEDSKDILENSLTEISSGLSDLKDIYNTHAYSEVTTYGLSNNAFDIYNELLSKYQEIRDTLPADLVEKLDTILNEDKLNNMFYFIEVCKYLSTSERGFDLLVSDDGLNFETITDDGFGDPYNYGCRVFAITNSGLSLGTANPFYGTQIWNLNDLSRGEIIDSVISNPEITYNKNPNSNENKGVTFNIDFNGNTLKSVQLNYKTLKEGTDYTLSDNEITLSESLLNSLAEGEYTLYFNFSAGSRSIATLNVVFSDDSTTPTPEITVKPSKPNTSTNSGSTNTDNNNSIDKLPQTGALISSGIIIIVAIVILSLGVILVVKKNKKSMK